MNDFAKSAYCRLFYREIEESICQLCRSDYILHNNLGTMALNFLERSLAVAFLKDGEVVDIKEIEYYHFAPLKFIRQFYQIDGLPSRLERYLRLGETRFRDEIINAFQLNKMVIKSSEHEFFLWEEYNLKIEIEGTSLKQVRQ
ncbi:hypothetical protein NBRC13296_05760 [Paenibacillus chitinolyticus]|uniref:hypothetical protein n=1 Tax=Paenibacillus chitinolyticus TaxID=79263 RepID=UPI003558D00C